MAVSLRGRIAWIQRCRNIDLKGSLLVIEPRLLPLLCCPANGMSLRVASLDELKGTDVAEALVRSDGLVLYPVVGDIPQLVSSAAIHRIVNP